MSQQTDGAVKSYRANAAIGQYRRAKFSSGKLVVAGETDRDIGTTIAEAFAADEVIGLELYTKQGTKKFVAGGNITQGALIYSAADGEVLATQATGAYLCGVALEAAADGDVFEAQAIFGEVPKPA